LAWAERTGPTPVTWEQPETWIVTTGKAPSLVLNVSRRTAIGAPVRQRR
jgi:hypothetical protein